MSQVFSADAVANTATTTLTGTTETTAVVGNFLNPPFQNAKGVVSGSVQLAGGSSTTAVAIRIRRNPNAENAQVALLNNVAVTSGVNVVLSISGADAIPDGRPVQYAITVTQIGATGNGSIFYASISAMLISG